MHELDHAVKVVCAWHPNCLLDLFYGRERKVILKGVEDAQIQISEHRADKVWRIWDGAREGCVALEAIAVPDRRDLRRINLKNAALQITLDLPVITILVYLKRGNYATFSDGYDDELGGLINSHRFVCILLWEHAERIRSGELRELAPFLLLFHDDPDPGVMGEVNDLVEGVADPQQRLELKSISAIIAERYFSEDLIGKYFKLEPLMIRETSIFKEIFDQRYNEGRVEGLVEGRVEGEISGMQRLLQKLLEKKFGPLSSELRVRLLELNNEALDSLATTLLELTTVDDLRAWLVKATTN